MRFRATGFVWVVVGLGCLVVSVIIVLWTTRETGQPAAEPKSPQNSAHEDVAFFPESSSVSTPPAPERPKKPVPPEGRSVQPPQPLTAAEPSILDEALEDSILNDPAAKENLGRQALNFVGADPVADEIWAWLINDPDLPPKVRQDLIEDLNENGFSDANGRRPTVDDLPLIESRMLLIEENAPFAMDEVNAAAFAEAYKDLANMWWRLTQ